MMEQKHFYLIHMSNFLDSGGMDDNDDVSTICQYKFEAVCLSDFKPVFFLYKSNLFQS